MVHTKTYIFTFFYQQDLVLFTMAPRNSTWKQTRKAAWDTHQHERADEGSKSVLHSTRDKCARHVPEWGEEYTCSTYVLVGTPGSELRLKDGAGARNAKATKGMGTYRNSPKAVYDEGNTTPQHRRRRTS